MKKGVSALISMVIGLVIILACFFLPWYSTRAVVGGQEVGADLYLDRSEMNFMGQKISQSNEGANFLNNTLYFTIITFILSIFALIGAIGYSYNIGNLTKMRNIGIVFGIITFILAIITTVYFMIASINQIQGAKSSYFLVSGAEDTLPDIGFWWNTNINGVEVSAGPGYAWYLMIIAGIVLLVSSILMFKNRKSEIANTM